MDSIHEVRQAAHSAIEAAEELADAWSEQGSEVPVIDKAIQDAKTALMIVGLRVGLYDESGRA